MFSNELLSQCKKDAIEETNNNGWNNHKFHSFLENATQQEFLQSQIPFFYAVQAFPRALALLASKIENSHDRLLVINNLYEEHGDGYPKKFHTETFKTFLTSLGWNNSFHKNPWIDEWIEGKLLITYFKPHEYAAYLSGIEYAYAPISDTISKHLNNYELICEQTHYSNHAVLDWEHGAELFEVALSIKPKVDEIMNAFKKGQQDFLTLYNHILIPTSKEISEFNKEDISFYYTRENFKPEGKAITYIGDPIEGKSRASVLMIASGGEHLINHLTLEFPFDIDAIDMNPHQIELCKTKINKLLTNDEISNKKENHIGKFEKVFLFLREYMGNYVSMIGHDDRADEKLKFAVDVIFSNKNLSLVFGDRATQYTKKSFSEHFYNVFRTMLLHKDYNNSFNILRGDDFSYSDKIRLDLIKNYNIHTLNWINDSFETLSVDKKYDIINISNIGDWMPLSEYRELLIKLETHLNNNGILIARKLLGDYSLEQELRSLNYRTEAMVDETQFYTETVIAFKN